MAALSHNDEAFMLNYVLIDKDIVIVFNETAGSESMLSRKLPRWATWQLGIPTESQH